MAEQRYIEAGLLPELPEPVTYLTRDLAYINDNSVTAAGSYNQIMYDSQYLQLQGNEFIGWNESFVWMQHTINAAATNASAIFCPLACTLKSGFPMLAQALVRLNQITVNNSCPNLQNVNNYQMLRRWSNDKLKISGATYLFWPSDCNSGAVQQRISSPHVSVNTDNLGVPKTANLEASSSAGGIATCGPPSFNSGLYQRLLDAGFPGAYYVPLSGTNAAWASSSSLAIGTSTPLGMNSYTWGGPSGTGSPSAPINVHTINMFYPLCLFSPVFNELGLQKPRVQITATLNGVASTSGTVTAPAVQLSGSSAICPIIYSADGLATNIGGESVISTGIASTTRMYFRLFTLPPAVLTRAIFPAAVLREYPDYVNTNFLNNMTGAKTYTITNGLIRPRRVIIYSYIAASGMSSGQTPETSLDQEEPSRSSCNITHSNITMQVGSRQIFANTLQYLFETYMQTIINDLIDDNTDDVMASGLAGLDLQAWQTAGILSFNLQATQLPPDQLDNKQIIFNTTVVTPVNVNYDLWTFVEVSRITRFHSNGRVEIVSG